ncbi:MAG TPA: transcription elongation factor GreA [Fimbriimonas sp.]|nr:transcription elongation factor GreA [Fimbriimonas sp.]
MASKHHLSKEGYEKLKSELEFLKGHERMRIAQAIREAKAHGDLRENAAYHEAKLNQTRLDARIAELEKMFQLAKIIDTDGEHPTARMGSTLKLLDLDFDDELTIKLVGSFEADPKRDLISISSPLGEALMGKNAGEQIEVAAPGGKTAYKILAIE